jgi:hypothetical protein
MKPSHIAERLKDRRDYCERLIQRQEEIDNKIKAVEKEIHELKEAAK